MALRPFAPGPVAASHFRRDVEGWRIASLADPSLAATPVWAEVNDPAWLALDVTGACRFTPEASDGGAWFFAAPGPFVTAMRGLGEGVIAIGCDTAAPASGATVEAEPDLVLRAPAGALGLRGTPNEGVGSPHVFEARLSAPAGWIDLATGAAATADGFAAVLAGLTDLLIRGGAADQSGRGDLYTVELYPDPLTLLGTAAATAWFDAGILTVALTPSPLASAYAFEVRDAAGALLFGGTEASSRFTDGGVALTSADFHPADNASYSVRMRALGLAGPDATAAFVELAAPRVAAAPTDHGLHLAWAEVPKADGYDLEVAAVADGRVLLRRSAAATGADLGPADGLAAATDYSARVRARAGPVRGPWSEPVPVRLATARKILQALLDRMQVHRSGNAIALDDAVLPAEVAGAPEVLAGLAAAFGAPPVTLAVSAEPVLTDESLTLDGAGPLLGADAAALHAVFTVSGDRLQLLLTVTPGADWRLSDGFDLAGTAWDELPLEDMAVLFASDADGAAEPFPIAAGLNLRATLLVSPQLQRLRRGDPAPDDALRARIGGSIAESEAGTLLALGGADPLGDLHASIAGFPALAIGGGRLRFSRAAVEDGTLVDRLEIAGSTSLGGGVRDCTLDFPSPHAAKIALAVPFTPESGATLGELLAIVGGSAGVPGAVAATFGSIGVSAVDRLGFCFDPSGAEATEAALTAAFVDDWEFVPGIALGNARLGIESFHFPEGRGPGFTPLTVRLSGHVAVGTQDVAVEILVPADGDWTATLANDPPLTFAALADLAGFDGTGAFAALPAPLRPAATVGVADIELVGRPAEARLSRARFTFVQTETWSLGGVLAIRDSRLALTVDLAASAVRGYFGTTVALGSGDDAVAFSANGPVPPEPGQCWTLALDAGQEVTLPGASAVMGWFGGTAPATPAGLSALSGIVVDRLLVRFDPAASPILRQLAVSARQAGDWTLIGPDALVLSGFGGRFDWSNAGRDLTLALNGSVTILGARIDAWLDRPAPGADWALRAQASQAIPAPSGVAGLDSWADPASMAGYLGAAAPLAGPAKVGTLGLAFDGASGELKRMSFGFGFDLAWELIPGKLGIDSLTAWLTTAVPASSSTWTGVVAGEMTLFGAHLRLSAAKPAPADPWLFRGELASIPPVDLAASAGSLADGAVYALPGGATEYGLPAAIAIETAEVEGAPETGYFRFRGKATFADWSVGIGAAQLQIRSLGGEILVGKSGDPLRVRLTGNLAFAGARIDTFVQLGTAPAIATIVAGVVAPDTISSLTLAAAVDAAAGAGTWSLAEAPPGFAPPGLTSAGFYLNLATKVLALYGQASLDASGAAYGKAALVVREVADNGADGYEYAFLAEVSDFSFAKLVPALSVLDEVITLRRVSVALSSFSSADEAVNPLAELDSVRANAAAEGGETPEAPAPPAATRIGKGLNVYAVLAFEGALWEAVGFVLDLKDAELTIEAAIDPGNPKQTLFLGQLVDATLFNYLHFPQIMLEYRAEPPAPAAASQGGAPGGDLGAVPGPPTLTVGGYGSLRLPGIPDIDFHGIVSFVTAVDAAGGQSVSRASFDAGIAAGETDLFGIPRVSLTLSNIHMAWALAGPDRGQWTREAFSIAATATLAGCTLDATIDLSDETRQSIRIALDAGRTLGLRSLLVDWLGATWLEGAVPDLGFHDGWLEWTRPASGAAAYRLHARASLIGFDFVFEIAMTDGKGVIGSAAPERVIDFGFLTLAGPGKTGGPVASLVSDDAARTIGLDTCATFFGQDFAMHLAYLQPADHSEASYDGTLQTDIDLGSLGTLSPKLIVNYSQSGDLDVRLDGLDVPWEKIKQALNLAEQIKRAMEGANGACKIVGDLGIGDDFLQCLFSCSLTFPRLTPQSGSRPMSVDIGLVANYGLKLNLPGYDQVIFRDTLVIPAFSIAPTSYSFAGIAQALVAVLVGAIPKIVSALFDNPDAVAKLGAAIAAQEAAQAALRQLACQQSEDKGDEPDDDNESGESGGDGWAGAVAAFSSAFGIAAGILGLLGAIIGALTGEEQRKKRRAEEQQERSVKGIANLTKPVAVSIACVGADRMRFGCTPPADVPEGNGATYDFDLFRVEAGGDPQPVPPREDAAKAKAWLSGQDAPRLTIAYDGLEPGATYYVAVTARVSIAGLISMGPFGDDKGPVIVKPRDQGFYVDADADAVSSAPYVISDVALVSVSLEQVGGEVEATLVEGHVEADRIALHWIDRNGQPKGSGPDPQPVAATAAGARHVLRLAPPVRSGEAILKATASAGELALDALSAALTLVDLPAPAISSASFDPASFEVRAAWAAVAGAGGYRVELFRDGEDGARSTIGTADAGTSLELAIPAGTEAGLRAKLRVATLPPSGPGAVWSEPLEIVIPGALVTLGLAAAPQGQPPEALAFTVARDQPPPPLSLTLEPGDDARPLGAAKVAVFSAERAEPVAAGASLVHRIAYTVQDIRDAIALSAPLGYDWPTPEGTVRSTDLALELPGGARLWQSDAVPLRNAIRTADAVSAEADRVTIVAALDTAPDAPPNGAPNRDALFAISRDPEALAATAPFGGRPVSDYEALATAAFEALGQPLDIVSFARLLTAAFPSAPPDDVTAAIDRKARSDNPALVIEAAAFRVAGLTMHEAALRLRVLRPEIADADLALALAGAFAEPSGIDTYAAALVAGGAPPPVLAARVLALAALGAPPASETPDDLVLRLMLRRFQGRSANEAATDAEAADPSPDADQLGAALAAAYFRPPSGRDAAAAALAAAFSSVTMAPNLQAWALVEVGLPVASASRLVDIAGALPPDSGERLRAQTALLAPEGAAEVMAALAAGPGSPLSAVRAARAALAPLSAEARLVLLVRVWRGLAARPVPLAAVLAVSGSLEAEACAALATCTELADGAAAAAWAKAQSLAADFA